MSQAGVDVPAAELEGNDVQNEPATLHTTALSADQISDDDDSTALASSLASIEVLKVKGPSSVDGASTQSSKTRFTTRRPKAVGRRHDEDSSDDEPLVDRTAALDLHSKRTLRKQKKLQKKEAKRVRSDVHSFLDLPHELLSLVLSFIEPSDIFNLLLINRATNELITDYEHAIVESIIARRYWVLAQCFRRPMPIDDVPKDALSALLSRQWQDRMKIHRNPYQHIKQIDSTEVCTCMSCVLAWNNLNIILDLAHWQKNLETREPLPIIPRGRNPEWNVELLARHAAVVFNAMRSPLTYARILQIHLKTTTGTIVRSSRWRKKGEKPNPNKPRLYHLTDQEIESGTDEFLERSGPPNYQPLYMRDNYYSVEAFIPNRKWDKEKQKWLYYANSSTPHENDLIWIMKRFAPATEA